MPQNVEPLENLVDQFARFPGIGRKSAVRMAYQVMSMPPEQAMELAKAIEHAKKNGTALHLLAYLTYKSSHGCIDYPLAICEMARDAGLDRVYFHIIFDGRSTAPGSAPALLTELDEKLDAIGVGRIVDGVGRGVALDRDKNYDKVKRAYDAMVDGAGTLYE